MFIVDYVKSIKTNNLVRGSFILFIGTMIVNIGSYIFNVMIARGVSAEDYGTYTALVTVLMIFAVPSGTIQIIITRFIAKYKGRADFGGMRRLFYLSTRLLIFVGIFVALIFFIISPWVAGFLKIPPYLTALLSLTFIVTFILPVNRGILAGNSLFGQLSVTMIGEIFIKIVLAYFVLRNGFGLKGLVLILSMSLLIVYLFSIPLIVRVFKKTKIVTNIDRGEIYQYIPTALGASFLMMLILNIDLILSKHYFNAHIAGQYAAMSTIGKIATYFPAAIGMALFPIVAEKKEKGENYGAILRQALILTGALSGAVVAIYFLMPKFVITILYGRKYIEFAPYLGFFGLMMLFFALANVLISYFLSVYAKGFIIWLVIGFLIQVGLIIGYHNNFLQLVIVNSLAIFGLMVMLMIKKMKSET